MNVRRKDDAEGTIARLITTRARDETTTTKPRNYETRNHETTKPRDHEKTRLNAKLAERAQPPKRM